MQLLGRIRLNGETVVKGTAEWHIVRYCVRP